MALTFPSSPIDGQVFTDPGTGNRYLYDAARGLWKFAANNVGMTVSSVPPAAPAQGAMWYHRDIGRTFVYYDDGDSKQWVEVVPAPGSYDSATVAGFANAATQIYLTPVYTNANAAFRHANSAFDSANNVAPQVTPSFNTANAAFNTANAAYASANNVAPQVTPAFTTANLAYAKANSALSNTNNMVFEGNLRVSYTVSVPAFYENDANITMNVTISTGRNAFSAGPVAIANGVFVTIPDGSYWSVT
jgi:hypothetical protein